jgi:hypothetical protein
MLGFEVSGIDRVRRVADAAHTLEILVKRFSINRFAARCLGTYLRRRAPPKSGVPPARRLLRFQIHGVRKDRRRRASRIIMALKFKFKSKDEIPADHLPLYAERDGGLVLDVEGAVDKAKLDEFRTTNAALLKERDELKQRFEGIDPEEVRQLKEAHQQAEEDRLLGRTKGSSAHASADGAKETEEDKERKLQAERERIEKVIEGRVKSIKGDLEKQVNQLTTERDTLNTRLAAIQIDQGVITVATKRGLRPTAMADITSRARTVFRLVNGVPTAFDSDGKSVRYGRDGLTPMSIDEWVDGQVAEAPHLFEANSGGGSGGNSNSAGGAGRGFGGKNPFKRETWNLTEQMKIAKSDPQLAARLNAAA